MTRARRRIHMLRRTMILALLMLLMGAGPALAGGGKKASGGKTGIEWNVVPPNVVIFLDGKKLGQAGSLTFTPATPGKHAVRMMKGGDRTETQVKVTKGQVVRFEFDFT